MDLAKRVEHPLSLVTAIGWEAWIHQLRREHEQTLARAEETMALSERLGFPLFLGLGRTLRGWALASSQKAEEGVALIQQALASLARSGTGIGAPQILGSLSLRPLALGIERARVQGQHYYDAELHRLRAEVLLDSAGGGVEEAEALLHRALEISRGQQARSFELRAASGLARLWQRQGKVTEARDLLQPIYGGFTEGFDTQDLKDAKALLQELS